MNIFEKEEHETVDDQSENEFEKVTDKSLLKYSALNQRDKIKIEMNRRLKKEIQRFNINSSIYSKRIIGLTIVLGILALIQTAILLIPLFTQT